MINVINMVKYYSNKLQKIQCQFIIFTSTRLELFLSTFTKSSNNAAGNLRNNHLFRLGYKLVQGGHANH